MIILSGFSALMLIVVCLLVYRKQQAKNSQKQTRIVLRDNAEPEDVRNRKRIEDISQMCEWDVNQYSEEVTR